MKVAALNINTVQVWHLEVPDQLGQKLETETLRWLSPRERSKVAEFPGRAKRTEYLLTRALLRMRLAAYYDLSPGDFEVSDSEKQRPQIKNMNLPFPVYFSISHTAGLISCAFSNFPEMGIDVENLQRDLDIEELVTTICATGESEQLKSEDPKNRKVLFFQYWTAKESYLKALGYGLVDNLFDIEFNIGGGQDPRLLRGLATGHSANDWTFKTTKPTSRHLMTLAAKSETPGVIDLQEYFVQLPL